MRRGEYVANGDIEAGRACAASTKRTTANDVAPAAKRSSCGVRVLPSKSSLQMRRERLRFAGLIVLFALVVRWLRRDTRHAFERGFARVEDFMRRMRRTVRHVAR